MALGEVREKMNEYNELEVAVIIAYFLAMGLEASRTLIHWRSFSFLLKPMRRNLSESNVGPFYSNPIGLGECNWQCLETFLIRGKMLNVLPFHVVRPLR
jgi:hypothetical protein